MVDAISSEDTCRQAGRSSENCVSVSSSSDSSRGSRNGSYSIVVVVVEVYRSE